MASHRLHIRDLTVSYHRVPAVHHVTLEMQCGKSIALLGPNGAGKTSFFKAMVGLIKPETGSIELGGHGARSTRHDIAYLPQREAVDWDFPVTVRGLAEMGRYTRLGWWRRFGPADEAAVEKALATMEARAGRSPDQRALRRSATARLSCPRSGAGGPRDAP